MKRSSFLALVLVTITPLALPATVALADPIAAVSMTHVATRGEKTVPVVKLNHTSTLLRKPCPKLRIASEYRRIYRRHRDTIRTVAEGIDLSRMSERPGVFRVGLRPKGRGLRGAMLRCKLRF